MNNDSDDLGIYFKCFRGANAHFALSEPHSFALQDAAGRDWICYPVPPHIVQEHDMLSDLVDLVKADGCNSPSACRKPLNSNALHGEC